MHVSLKLMSLYVQEHLQLKTAAILALAVGCVPHSLHPFLTHRSVSPNVDDLQDWAKVSCFNSPLFTGRIYEF